MLFGGWNNTRHTKELKETSRKIFPFALEKWCKRVEYVYDTFRDHVRRLLGYI